MNTEPNATDKTHPWVGAAFNFVVPSYQIMAARYESADSRLGALIGWTLGLTAAMPVLGRAINPDIVANSGWFFVGLALFVVSFVVSLVGRRVTRLTVADPAIHHTKAGTDTDWEFKRLAIVHAGRHMALNSAALERKATAEWYAVIALGAGVLAMTIWVLRG
jgi:hypothetical protein